MLWGEIEQRVRAVIGDTPLTLIVYDMKFVNREIRIGQYFSAILPMKESHFTTPESSRQRSPRRSMPRSGWRWRSGTSQAGLIALESFGVGVATTERACG
jgi:hypothetical protein